MELMNYFIIVSPSMILKARQVSEHLFVELHYQKLLHQPNVETTTLVKQLLNFLLDKVCYDQFGVERESRKGEFRSSCGRVGTGMLEFDDLEVAVNGVRSRNSSMVVTFFSGTTCMARGYFLFAECVNVSRQDTPDCVDSIEEKKRQISNRFVSYTY